MRAEVAVAGADRGSEPFPIPGVELVELSAAPGADRHGEDHLDPVDLVFVEQAAQHVGLDRAEIDGHEGMRDDGECALVVDRGDRVLERHSALDGLFQEPGEHVCLGGPSRGDLLTRDDGEACGRPALLRFLDRGHGVVVRDRDQVEAGGHGRVD